jgi:ABC-type antimicrobial peptide transport system ATPase subunit
MCRGMKYNLEFKLKDGSIKVIDELSMSNLMNTIKALFVSEYGLDDSLIRLSNQVIFNLMNPHKNRKVSKMISTYCKVTKYVKPENDNEDEEN